MTIKKNKWQMHLDEYREQHPEESLKVQMQKASKTYNKMEGKK